MVALESSGIQLVIRSILLPAQWVGRDHVPLYLHVLCRMYVLSEQSPL